MTKLPRLLVATRNKAKVGEYLLALRGIPYRIVTLTEVGVDTEVSETGKTLEDNASIKARAYASLTGLTALADDSGLEVDALGGEPGVLSARYAGEGVSDQQRIDYLLSRLQGVPRENRTARFRCVIAIATPHGAMELCKGECDGIIALQPRGSGGFGYDPVFFLPQYGRTMAELTMEEKNEISHRGKAAREARRILERFT